MAARDIPWRVTLLVLLVTLVLAVSGLFIVTANILLLTFAGVLAGIFLNAAIHAVCGFTHLGYRSGFATVVIASFVATGLTFYIIGSGVADHAYRLSGQLEKVTSDISERIEQSQAGEYLPSESELREILTSPGGAFSRMLAAGRWIMWGVTGLIVILFVCLYTAYDPHLYKEGLVKLFPMRRRGDAEEVLRVLRSTLIRWVLARMMSMAIIGILTAVGLWLLGVPMPISLGVLAAILTFVPNIGPIVAAVPQVLLALDAGPNVALYVVLFNIGLQGVETYLVTPMIERYEVKIPPAVVIFAQLLLGVCVGMLGVIMAAPLAASLMVLVQLLYIRDKLGDDSPGEMAEEAS